MQAICSRIQDMVGYFAFGTDAVGKPPAEWPTLGLPPLQTNWSVNGDYRRPGPDASRQAIAMWAWIQICCTRNRIGMPVTLPSRGRMIGTINNLFSRMSRQQVIEHVLRTTERWEEIRASLGNWGSTLCPDEGVLAINAVVTASAKLAGPQHDQQQSTEPMVCRASGEDAMKILRDIYNAKKERKAS